MQTSKPQPTARNSEQIARVAYRLWEQAGRPAGRDVEFWLKAEQQIASPPPAAARSGQPSAKPAPTAVPTSTAPPAAFIAPTKGPATRAPLTQPRRISSSPAPRPR